MLFSLLLLTSIIITVAFTIAIEVTTNATFTVITDIYYYC